MRLVRNQNQEGPPVVSANRNLQNFDVNGENSALNNQSSNLLSQIVLIQRTWRTYFHGKRRFAALQVSQGANNPGSSSSYVDLEDLSETDSNYATQSCATQSCSGASSHGSRGNSTNPTMSSMKTDEDAAQRSEDDDLQFDSSDDLDAAPTTNNAASEGRCYSELIPPPYSLAARCGIDSEPESIASDYSEMADPIREHLANVQIIRREDLDLGNAFSNQFTIGQRLGRGVDEDEVEYSRRVRKTNLLSLAQEFAALKRIKADALPFDLHEEKYRGGGVDGGNDPESEGSSDSDAGASTSNVVKHTGITEKPADPEIQTKMLPSNKAVFTNSNIPPSSRAKNSPARSSESVNSEKIPILLPGTGRSSLIDATDTQRSKSNVPDVVVPCIPPITIASLSCSPARSVRSSPAAAVTDTKQSTNNAPTMTVHKAVSEVGNPATTGNPVMRDSPAKKKMDESVTEEFDVYTMESSLPAMDWQHLEDQLLRAAEDEQNRRLRCGDREEIRRKLAMSMDDDSCFTSSGGMFSSSSSLQRKQPLHGRLQSGMNLQMCYVNDAAAELEGCCASDDPTLARSQPDVIPECNATELSRATVIIQEGGAESNWVEDDEDFFSKQAHLRAEAKLALAQVRPMAHMQLQLEKQLKKKSPIAEIVSIPGFSCGKKHVMNRRTLQLMNLARLQVVVNDLHAQIEGLNIDLMQQLVDRDDLHMAQDSMLVDIEDLTGRAQEFADRVNKMTQKKAANK